MSGERNGRGVSARWPGALTLAAVMATSAATSVAAAQESPATSEEDRPNDDDENGTEPSRRPAHHVTLHLQGVFGALLSKENDIIGGGGSVAVSIPLVRTLELEISVAAIKPKDRRTLGVYEMILKYVFETESAVHPHLGFGPLLSLDFGSSRSVAGGFVLVPGMLVLLTPSFGLTLDIGYRFLAGEGEVEHVLTVATGIAVRL